MKRFITNSNSLKGAVLGFFALAIIASPFSVSFGTDSVHQNTAEAAAACPSGYGLPLDMGNGTTQCTDSGDNGLPTIYINNQTGAPTGSTLSTGTQTDATGKAINQPVTTDCQATVMYVINFPTCLFRTIVTYTAATLIYFASWILTLSGVLFNWLIDNTIVHFTNIYTSGVQSAVEGGWSAFRDIANILIIGMFTFIAISIILGIHEFNQKKLIANVLLIAVFINFSLLATKMIIDVSNFTAGQIYSAAALGANGAQYNSYGTLNPGQASGTNVASAGIAGNFINLLGVQSFGATQTSLDKIAQNSDNGWIALLHGIFVFIILVGAAAVLFYGSFLLISRVILLMFLMFTASLAFASYLVPAWSGGSYGWKAWWGSLISCAALAPVLMLLLWITMNVAFAIHSVPGSGSFGDMIAHPEKIPNIATLVNYCIILGLLFVSFKLSSKFASKIAGFSVASFVPAIGAGLLGQIGGFAGRQTFGRAGMYVSSKLQNKEKNTDNVFAQRLYGFGARQLGSVGKKDFNFMRTGLGTAIAGTAGAKVDTLAGKALKGFEGTQKEFLKQTAEQARGLTLSNDEKKAVKEKGLQKALTDDPELKRRYDAAKSESEDRENLAKVIRSEAATANSQAVAAVKDARDEVTSHTVRRDGLAAGSEEHTDATRDVAEAENRLHDARAREKETMNSQAQRIREANEVAKRAGNIFGEVGKQAEEAAKASGHIPEAAYRDAGDNASRLVKNSISALLLRSTAISAEGQEKLAKAAAKEAGKQEKKHHFDDDIGGALKEYMKGGGHNEEAPAAPAHPAPAEHPAEHAETGHVDAGHDAGGHAPEH